MDPAAPALLVDPSGSRESTTGPYRLDIAISRERVALAALHRAVDTMAGRSDGDPVPGGTAPCGPAERESRFTGGAQRADVNGDGHDPNGSAGEEAQADEPLGIVDVRIEQGDRLPRAEGELTADHRNGQRGRDEQRHDVIGAVPGRAVAMAPALIARQEPVQRGESVVVRAGPQLQDRQARGGMGHEHRKQPIAACRALGDEPSAGSRQVAEATRVTGRDSELKRLYGKIDRRASRIRPRPPIAGADS